MASPRPTGMPPEPRLPRFGMTEDQRQAAQFRLISAEEAQRRRAEYLALRRGGPAGGPAGPVVAEVADELFVIRNAPPTTLPPTPWRLAIAAGLGVGVLMRGLREAQSVSPASIAADLVFGDVDAALLGAVVTVGLRWGQHRIRAGQVYLRAVPENEQRVQGGLIFGEAVPVSVLGRREVVEAACIGALCGLAGRRVFR